jgi:hypothetical protein
MPGGVSPCGEAAGVPPLCVLIGPGRPCGEGCPEAGGWLVVDGWIDAPDGAGALLVAGGLAVAVGLLLFSRVNTNAAISARTTRPTIQPHLPEEPRAPGALRAAGRAVKGSE